jgi:hypothetical protein
MKVYVVMKNDFPDSVFANEVEAAEYVINQNNVDRRVPRTYWRWHELEVYEKKQGVADSS